MNFSKILSWYLFPWIGPYWLPFFFFPPFLFPPSTHFTPPASFWFHSIPSFWERNTYLKLKITFSRNASPESQKWEYQAHPKKGLFTPCITVKLLPCVWHYKGHRGCNGDTSVHPPWDMGSDERSKCNYYCNKCFIGNKCAEEGQGG